MTVVTFFQLFATTLIPAIVAVLLHLGIKKWKKFSTFNFYIQQLIIGLVFTILAIGSFYFGAEYNDFTYGGVQLKMIGVYGTATAIPLVAGLLFGWPSGLIAAILGATYRLFMNRFGAGDYLRAAECISLLLAGGLAAILRVTLFDNKKPKWLYGIAIGLLMEVAHMCINFITISLQKDIYYAYGIVSQADVACTICVGLVITLSILGISLLEKEKIKIDFKSQKISDKTKKWFGVTFILTVIFTTGITVVAFMRKQERDNRASLVNALIDSERNLDKLDGEELKPEGQLRKIFSSIRVGEEGFFIAINPNDSKILATSEYIVKSYNDMGLNIYDYSFHFDNNKTLDDYKNSIFVIEKEGELNYIVKGGSSFLGMVSFKGKDNEGNIVEQKAKYVCVFADYKNDKIQSEYNNTYRICALLPYDESIINAGLSIRLTIYLEVLVFIAIFMVFYVFIKKVVISNIIKINKDLSLITGGNLNVFVNVRENEEFASLSDDINRTVDTLKRYIDEANKRIDKELAFAKEIQYSSLPSIFPTDDKFDLYALMSTAKEVGGDFYDFFMVDKERIMILVADVSGKGIPASLFMMRAKTLVKSLIINQEYKLNDVIAHVNNELCANNAAGMFVTAWFGILNLSTGVMEYTNAGHNPPLVKRNGEFTYLNSKKNLVLAGMEDTPYNLETLKLEPGDEILLYTDGVTEATNKETKLYGNDRLLDLVNRLESSSSEDFLKAIKDDVDKFQKDESQADDITLLSLRYKPSPIVAERFILIKPKLTEIKKVSSFIEENFNLCHINKDTQSRIFIALDELLSSIINRLKKENDTNIIVSFKVISNVATITISDNGKPFNIIEKINEANANVALKEENIPIISMLLVKKVMHKISYEYINNKNVLTIKKHIK